MGTGLLAVAARELSWLLRDRAARILVLLVPLLAFAILAATFKDAVIRDLRVDIVDEDRSLTSAAFVQAIGAAPGVVVDARSGDLTSAMHSIRSGGSIAAVYIPRDLERDILAAKRPQIVIFYNKQYFTPGNIASTSLQSAIGSAVASLPKGTTNAASNVPGALAVEQYVLTNPALNYAQFLLRAILPTVLHILMACSAGYAVGSEFGRRGMGEWMRTANGSALTALTGKLLPYFCIFILMMVVGTVVIHGFFGISFRGNAPFMAAAGCLLVMAYLALGALLQLLTKNLATSLMLAGLICSPAFGFLGVGFPVQAMNSFAQGWGSMLPLRWYVQILFDQASRGIPVRDSAVSFMWLSLLAAGLFAAGLWRLRSVARTGVTKPAEPLLPEQTARAGLGLGFGLVQGFIAECGRVLRDRGVFGLMVLGPVLYGALYPQPYLSEVIKGVPIAVVDQDTSGLSHSIIQALAAHEALVIANRSPTLVEAEAALARGEVFGIVSIPPGTQRDVLKGARARLPVYVDSAYFLMYSRTLQGVLEAVGTVSAEMAGGGAREDGSLYRAALSKGSPVEILNQPLFNPAGGYASYIVPAAFVLILQQTLMMGAATLGGLAYEQGGRQARQRRGAPMAVLGQALAHMLLVLPCFGLYLVVLPRVFGFSSSQHVLDLLAFSIPFILSVSFLGQFAGAWFKRRESAVLLLIAISLPLFFLVGVAWPIEAIPEVLRKASLAFPSTPGINGLVRINQMGASFADVAADWNMLWMLTGTYAALAVVAAKISGAWSAIDGH